MSQFSLIFRHYLRRSLHHPIWFVSNLVFPLAFMMLYDAILSPAMYDVENAYFNGYSVMNTLFGVLFLLMFQFMAGITIATFLEKEFEGPHRWRILASPCALSTYLIALSAASMVFALIAGFVLIIGGALLLNVYWGNMLVVIIVMLLLNIFSHFFLITCFLFTRKKLVVEIFVAILSIAFVFIGGFFMTLPGDACAYSTNRITWFFAEYGSPLALGRRAIMYSGYLGTGGNETIIAIAILLVVTVLSALVFMFAVRRRNI